MTASMHPVYYNCCRICNTKLLPTDRLCPACGARSPEPTGDPFAARTVDVILSVILAAVTIGLTIMINIPAAQSLMEGFWRFDLLPFLLTGIWNFMIVGLPIIVLGCRWYLRVRHGNFYHATAWRDYWTIQLLALSPVLVVTGGIAAIYVAMLAASFVAAITTP